MTVVQGSVTVGVDGSSSSLEAVDLAAEEARLRGRALHVVHAFLWPLAHMNTGPSPLSPTEGGLRNSAERIVSEAVERARAAAPEVEVTSALITGEPLSVLAEQSHHASLLVVGGRGRGGFAGLLTGSVPVQLASHSRCPVLVVRGRGRPSGEVLLGVDGSPAGEAAVGFAFTEASLRGAGLVALHAWSPWSTPVPEPPEEDMPYSYKPGMLRDDEERLLHEALSGWRERCPEVSVEHRLVRARTREALIEASESASLVVVGARGRGGFAGLLLGSVSQAVLHHAHCPVAVVRHDPVVRRA